MTEIKKSYLSLIWRAIWGIVLIEIPFFMRWAQIGARHYSYDNENLNVKRGIFSTYNTTVPLYKIENVTTNCNVFGNGTLYVSSQVSGAKGLYLDFVGDANAEAAKLNKAIAAARAAHNVRSVDAF